MDWNSDDTPRYGSLKIIDEIPPFQHAIEFELDPEVNVFIGPNATGKSTILKLLCQQFPHNVDRNRFAVEWRGRGQCPQVYLPPVRDVAPVSPSEYGRIGPEEVSDDFLQGLIYDAVLEVLDEADYLNPEEVCTRVEEWGIRKVIDRALQDPGPILTIKDADEFDLKLLRLLRYDQVRADGVSLAVDEKEFVTAAREEARKQLQGFEGGRFLVNGVDPYTSFPAGRVKLALDRLRLEDHRGRRDHRWDQVMEVAEKCCYDICHEVFTGKVDTYREREYRGSRVVSETSHPGEGFVLRGTAGNETVYIGQLSTGTQGLWWWICRLALKLAYGHSRDRFKQPAILLIDEIENHLHPTWQRRVIPALRKHFPGLQIFATTHSPFVVAGLKRGQVHRLYREKGVIKTDQLTEEEKEHKLVGWTVEQILRKFMDVTDPTDEATATAAATLRWLQGRQPPPEVSAADWVQECLQHLQDNHERDENETAALVWLAGRQQKEGDALATINAVEWRAEVLGELRTLVSLDIEAGGPFAAQRERFTAQLRKLLAKDQPGSQDPDEEG